MIHNNFKMSHELAELIKIVYRCQGHRSVKQQALCDCRIGEAGACREVGNAQRDVIISWRQHNIPCFFHVFFMDEQVETV